MSYGSGGGLIVEAGQAMTNERVCVCVSVCVCVFTKTGYVICIHLEFVLNFEFESLLQATPTATPPFLPVGSNLCSKSCASL